MSDLNYNPDNMTFNQDDRAFLAAEIDTIYKRVAEVVIKQNERFFVEQEKQNTRICNLHTITDDHEKRLQVLEKERRQRRIKKYGLVALVTLIIVITVLILI